MIMVILLTMKNLQGTPSPRATPCLGHLLCISALNSHSDLLSVCPYYPHFTEEEAEAP